MKAFHGDEKIKQKYVDRMTAHIDADDLVGGYGWDGGKGCAVGCTLDKYNHKAYEKELGIPEWLAHLEDKLFETMSMEKSKTFPLLFLEAIKPGVDLDQIKIPFMVYVLESTIVSLDACIFDREENPEIAQVVDNSRSASLEAIRCYKNSLDLAYAARTAASASDAAYAAARTAVKVANAAESAAYLASDTTTYAVPRAAADAVAAAATVAAAFDTHADKLLELLKKAV